MVKVRNIHTFIPDGTEVINIMRPSVFSNPYYMGAESDRDECCDKYQLYFEASLENNLPFERAIETLVNQAAIKDITLLCCCYPKRCHGETIAEYVNNRIGEK